MLPNCAPRSFRQKRSTTASRRRKNTSKPEIHLHPGLQKKFAKYIADSTTNQYFISTHSSAFIDLPDINTYRCWLEDGKTRCELASSAVEKHAVVHDLGYRASDLLQANFAIWVEGPSDRIYINHWVKAKAPDLREGIDYSIMFYGGRLLSHLSYDETGLQDFIRLACINRSACMVIDSDRESKNAPLSATKQRIQRDFEAAKCMVWITDGHAIENYVDDPVFQMAARSESPRFRPHAWKPFAHLTRHRKNEASIDKVSVARYVCKSAPNFDVLNLGERVDQVVARIRARKT